MPTIPMGNFRQATVVPKPVTTRVGLHDGDSFARATQNLGAALHQVGELAASKQQQADESTLMDFENALVADRNRLLEDPNEGAVVKRGRDAIGISTRYMDDWQQLSSERMRDMPESLQGQARQLVERHGQTLRLGLARHELKEADSYHAATANAGIELAIDEAISKRGDSEAMYQAMQRGMEYAATDWDRRGIVGEQQRRLREGLFSAMHLNVIDATAQSDPDEAERLLARYRKYLTASDTLEAEKALRPATAERAGRGIAESLFYSGTASAPGGNYTGEVTRIRPSESLVRMDAAERRKLRFNDPALDGYAAQVEQEQGLPPGLLNALKNAGEKSNSWQTSPAGAQGVMQFMPATGKTYGLTDPGDPLASIQAAGRYMHDLLRQYDGNVDAAIAHYNGGTKAGNAVAEGRSPPAQETRGYLDRVRSALGPSSDASPAARAARPRNGNPATVAEMMLAMPANLPTAERNAAEQHLRVLVAARDAQKARETYESGMVIYGKATKLPPTQPITMALSESERQFLAENPDVLASIGRYRELVAAGSVIRDDPVIVDKLHRMRAEDPTAFRTYPIAKHSHELSGATLGAFVADQLQANKPEKAAQWASEAEVLKLAAADIGLIGDSKERSKERGEFDLAYYREKQSFVREHQREPNADEMQVIVNRLKQPFARRRWWGGEQADRRAYQGAADGYTVPSAARAQIVAALQGAGVAQPTEQQIVETYLNTGDASL